MTIHKNAPTGNTTSRLLLATLAVASLGLYAPISQAADVAPGYVPTAKMVQYDDLNLANPQGVERLYARIAAAAHEVCDAHGVRALNNVARAQICFRQSIARAVAAAGSPKLTALYAAKTGQQIKGGTLARR
jgi:UrcA family protein